MQKRLAQVGMRPISLAVDVTNYVMMLLGQPLHAFDLDTLSGAVGIRRARAGERLPPSTTSRAPSTPRTCSSSTVPTPRWPSPG